MLQLIITVSEKNWSSNLSQGEFQIINYFYISDNVRQFTKMFPSRRSQFLPMLSSFFSSPFFIGLLVGFSLHLYSRGLGQIKEDVGIERSIVTGEKKQAFFPTKENDNKNKEENENFVRPRFVKVRI